MSSGSKIKLYVAEETSLGVLPAQPTWYIVPRVTDGLTENVTTTASQITKNTRYRQSQIATQAEVTGTLETELSIGTFDLFLSAGAMNDWTADVLSIGGEVRKSFTFIKDFGNGVIRKYTGMMINTLTFTISQAEILGLSLGMLGKKYEPLVTSPVTAPVDLSGTPLVSSLNVRDFKLDDQSVVGTACLQSLTLEINNNLEAVYCIGNEQLSAETYIEKAVDITLTTQYMFSGQVADYSDKIKTGDKVTVSFSIRDSELNEYEFDFPNLQVSEAPHPDAGGEDLVMQDITFAHIETAPTITRLIQTDDDDDGEP